MPGAPQIQALHGLKLDPPPVIIERTGVDELELLDRIARRHELAATDDLHLAVSSNFQPDLSLALELPGKLAYVWAFEAGSASLLEQATRFIEAMRADGTLRQLDDRYFGHIRRLDGNDIAAFLANMRTRLPDYRHAFHEAQEITGIDWRLIAALAYQESQWDPLATSPTGVRGMMMLTEDTADRLRVTNRLDARQSIRAGARYLAMLMDELPEEIAHPDRLWLRVSVQVPSYDGMSPYTNSHGENRHNEQ
jgi:membrane-bound lytic murein transglycosylase F